MVMPILNIPLFPNVPLAPGVPPVFRDAAADAEAYAAILTADADYVARQETARRWGIVNQSGAYVLEPDSTVSVAYNRDSRILTYPVEGGGFRSYNKVQMPFEPVVTLSKGGKLTDREAFINKLEELVSSYELYNFITPEHTFLNVNIERIAYDRRSDRSAGMITVDVFMKEVRVTGVSEFINTVSPDGTAERNAGPVQVSELSDEEKARFMSGFQ